MLHHFGIFQVAGLGMNRVRAGPDQRQVAMKNVEKLRQLVHRGLAQKAANGRYARIVLGDGLFCGRIAEFRIHGPELPDVDGFIVEAMALLLEEDRPLGRRFDGDCRAHHDRPQKGDTDEAEGDVEQPLRDGIPVPDRFVENVKHRHLADVGIGTRAKAQLVGMRRNADIDREHPKLSQKLENACLGA